MCKPIKTHFTIQTLQAFFSKLDFALACPQTICFFSGYLVPKHTTLSTFVPIPSPYGNIEGFFDISFIAGFIGHFIPKS